MAKQLNIDLRFNADTSAAKAQLQSLQTSINQLTTSMATQGAQFGITPKIQEAQQAAVQLKTALSQSMNVETGKFDLSKFNSSLKSMNTDLSKLKTQLVNLGPSGQQTFMTLAQSIMTAEIPTKRISASLAALGTTLKNTAKWQLSSSMLHGFMSAVQTSYRYAQDLNKSLNNIRIVTGESAEAMDQFAARANKAAKALSASTLDYTNAALIYYQQGLKGKEVEERAEVTLKLANVSRQSAEIVSDQMTAIWNNFYDGSKSLEYYADVLTALGAKTASSTDEIAGGLEKFAAVGETIGLSYEYAAGALATITSNTRQSEEVVGTALKTIFARIQGLKLGETLEDGTSLNKYSEALYKIGIDIFDANKNLKNMDTILDETAKKWDTLGRAEQTALAQTVAGVRQYTQFVALMDNWDDGTTDSMVNNLETAANATGELQDQADIYAESWEGANKRVKAAIEEVYMDLLDDDFFIGITNGLADVLGLLDNFLDAMGGAKGLLSGLASVLLYTFSGPAAKALENMVYNFKTFVGLTQKEAMATQTKVAGMVQGIGTAGTTPLNNQQTNINTGMQGQVELQHQLLGLKDKFSETDNLIAQNIIEQNKAYADQVTLLGQALDLTEKKKIASQISLNDKAIGAAATGMLSWENNPETVAQDMDKLYSVNDKVVNTDLVQARESLFGSINANDAEAMKQALLEYARKLQEGADEIEAVAGKEGTELSQSLKRQAKEAEEAAISNRGRAPKDAIKAIQKDKNHTQVLNRSQVESSVEAYGKKRVALDTAGLEEGSNELKAAQKLQGQLNTEVKNHTKNIVANKKALKENTEGIKTYAKQTEDAKKKIQGLGNTARTWSQTMVGAAQGAMSLSFAISSLNSLKSTWADETIGTGEKLLQTFMSLGMAIPMLINGFNGLKTSIIGSNTIQTLAIGLMQTRVALEKEDLETLTAKEIAKKTGLSLDQAEILLSQMKNQAILQEIMSNSALSKEEMAQMAIQKMGLTTDQAEVLMSKLKGTATLEEALAEMGLTTAKGTGTLATIASTIANWGWLASMSPILAIALVLVTALAGLALVIWIVVSAVKAISNAINAEKIAVEQATEALEAATEAYNRANEAAQELKKTIEDYENAVKALDELKYGSEEYAKALEEANNKAKELIKSQELYGKFHYEKGLIVFDDGVLEGIQSEADKKVREAQVQQTHAQINLERKQLDRSIHDKKISISYEKSTNSGTLTETQVLTKQEKQKIVNAFVASGKDIQTMSNKEIADFVYNIDGLSSTIYQNIGAIARQREAFAELINETKSASERINNFLKEETENRYKSEYAGEIKRASGGNESLEQMIAAGMSNAIPKTITSKEEFVDSHKWFDASTIKSNADLKNLGKAEGDQRFSWVNNDANLAQAYAHYIMGYSWDDVKRMKYEGDNGKGTLSLDGEEFSVNDELMRKQLAEDWMNDYLGKSWEKEYSEEENKAVKEYADMALTLGKTDIGNLILQQSASNRTTWKDSLDLTQLSDANYSDLSKFYYGGGNENNEALLNYLGITPEQLTTMGYESVGEFVSAFKAGFEDLGSQEEFYQKQADNIIAQGASAYELDSEVVTVQAKQIENALKNSNKELENAATIAAEIAVANQRMNKGVDKLTDSWKDWKKTLEGTDKRTQDYAEAVIGAQEAMRDILGLTEEEIIPADFFEDTENIDLLDQIANGSEEAVDKLSFNLQRAQVESLEMSASIRDNLIAGFKEAGQTIVDDNQIEEKFNSIKTNYINALNDIQSELNSLDPGEALSPEKATAFATALNEYAAMTGMTVTDMENTLREMDVSADVTTKEVDLPQYKTVSETIQKVEETSDPSSPVKTYKITEEVTSKQEPIPDSKTTVAQINMGEEGKGEAPTITKSFGKGNINSSVTSYGKNSGGGGGKSSKPKTVKTESKKKNDEVERYHEINQELEDLQNNLDDIANLKDEAWGADKLALMDKEKKKLDEIITAHKKYQAEIAKNLNDDRWEAETKYGAQIDSETGRITNYEELQEQWKNEWNTKSAELDARENAAGDNEDEKTKIEEERKVLDEEYEAKRKAIEQYEETLNLSEEAKQQLDDYLRQLKEIEFEKITYKMEVQMEISEVEMERIDYYLDKMEDDFYKAAERVLKFGDKISPLTNSLKANYTMIDELQTKYAANEITQADYMQGLQDGQSNMIDTINELESTLEEVGEYYLNTLDQVNEKLDIQTEKFDNLTAKLQHFKDVAVLINGEQDYETLEDIISAEEQVATDALAASEARLSMYKDQEADIQQRLELAKASGDQKTIDKLEKDLNEVQTLITDEESKIMDSITRLGELAMEELTNTLGKAKKKMQETLFGIGGANVDSVMAQIDRLNAKQEEYLTNTNKLYQTNKLIRQAQMDMDKTDNQRAKQHYNDYIKYIEQLQQSGQLSQFELELAQADYEILQKKIALEEAQDAKNQVRLTRDAEGNYGYVYTANQDNIAQAEQEFADAQNERYNIALEGAKKYQDQYYQAIADMNAALEELEEQRQQKLITDEEYDKRKVEITQTYLDIAKAAHELYYTATGVILEESADVREDYTLMGVGDMKKLYEATDQYLYESELAFDNYDIKIDTVRQHNEDNFGKIDTAIKKVKDESETLKNYIVEKLIPTMDEELTTTLENSMLVWGNLQTSIKEAREEAEKYMKTIDELMEQEKKKINKQENNEEKPKEETTSSAPISQPSSQPEEKESASVNDIKTYTVKSEDTLWDISKKLYNDSTRWEELYEKNKDIIGDNPHLIYPGQILQYASGGYTGSWGPEGKLAVLHEKELVLNKQDTANFLTATEMLREISQMLDNNALIASLGMINLQAMTIGTPADQVLQQEVTIHADFPNVTDHNEIEIAIDNLINAASQHAYKV